MTYPVFENVPKLLLPQVPESLFQLLRTPGTQNLVRYLELQKLDLNLTKKIQSS